MTVTATVPIVAGEHVLYVRGQDSVGNWGPWSSVLVMGADNQGPTTSGITIAPDRTNGSVDVAVSATANDSASGGTAIGGAELRIDGGAPTAMALVTTGPVASLHATIPAATVAALTEGNHVVSIRSRDAVTPTGNWGDPTTATIVVDKTGPAASDLKVEPDPSNGLVPVNASTPSVRFSATMTDNSSAVNAPQSTVVKAEAFVDSLGAVGTGIPLEASDGAWSTAMENVYLDIPLATVRQMTEGPHTLYVRGKDAAGNWGTAGSTVLHVDKTAPALTTLSLSPNPTGGAASVSVSGTATDSLSAVTAVEWFRGTDPGPGNGTALAVSATAPWTVSGTISTAGLNEGTTSISFGPRTPPATGVRLSQDADGHRSPAALLHRGQHQPAGVAGTADDSDIYEFNGTTHSRFVDMSTVGVPTARTSTATAVWTTRTIRLVHRHDEREWLRHRPGRGRAVPQRRGLAAVLRRFDPRRHRQPRRHQRRGQHALLLPGDEHHAAGSRWGG